MEFSENDICHSRETPFLIPSPAMKIDHADDVMGALMQAFTWEPIRSTEMFDRIVARLRRTPMFRGMSIGEIDLILADARNEFELSVSEYEGRLVDAFEDALEEIAA
jgi:hypothetical protein